MRALILLTALALPLAACSEGIVPDDDDDSTPDEEEPTPEPIPDPLFDQPSAVMFYEMDYTSGNLEGQSCTEEWAMTSVDVTAQVPQRLAQLQETCLGCDTLFQAYFTIVADPCVGGAEDIPEDNFISFDTASEEGSATFYWFLNNEWYDLGGGELDYDEVEIVVDDPDQGWGGFGGNSTTDDPCGFFNQRCRWEGRYINFFDLGTLPHPDTLDDDEE